jgi:hypothetical protein
MTFALFVSPDNRHCARPNSLTYRKMYRSLPSFHNNRLRLLSSSRAQLPNLPKQLHSLSALATKVAQMFQPSPKERQLAPFLYEPLAPLAVPNRFEFASLDGTLDGHPSAIEPSRQLICRHGHCRSPQTHSQQFE